MKLSNFATAFTTAAILGFSVPANAAGDYKFYVSCEDGHKVVAKFRYGDIDPGRELARVLTGYDFGRVHRACSVSNFDASKHAKLPVDELKYRHTDGQTIAKVLQGDLGAIVSIVVGVGETVANDITKGPGDNNDLVGKNGAVRKFLGF